MTTTKTRASDYFEPVLEAAAKADKDGISIRQLSEALNVRTRVLDNVTYRLEKDGKIQRVGKGRRYVAVKPARARRTRKTTAQ